MWLAVVNAVMNSRVLENVGAFLSTEELSLRNVLPGGSYLVGLLVG
jgi:hypothetical protein